jgi:hypothetical protein
VSRSAQQIVDQTIEIANIIYASRGYVQRVGFKYWLSKHPHELQAWDAACKIQEFMTDTDPDDALAELEDDEGDL